MKHSILYTLSMAVLALFMGACSEEGFTTFDGRVAGIYLQRNGSYNVDSEGNIISSSQQYVDSTSISFASIADDVMTYTVPITVKIMGYVTDYDRPFTLKVDEQASTAVRGTHFDYNETDCVIPAGAAQTNVPVTLYRTDDLVDNRYKVVFYLESNENFTTELEQYKSINSWSAVGDTLCGTRYSITFSEIYTEPFQWEIFFGPDYAGDWSVSKEKRVNALMGWSHADWDNGTVTLGVMAYAAQMLRRDLQAAADSGEPVIDDDGEYMQLVGNYRVDYSAYE